MEAYLRYMQIAGVGDDFAWSARPLSATRIPQLISDSSADIWGERRRSLAEKEGRFEVRILSPTAAMRINSHHPYGSGDGAIWSGRGLTASASAGVRARVGPVTMSLAPTAFAAQNAAFDYPGAPCPPCREPSAPNTVDRPIRFGTETYSRLSAGQSYVKVDFGAFQMGLSNENLGWGPARAYPFLVGANADGFPHLSLAIPQPTNIGIGRITSQVIYGRLDQSGYAPVTSGNSYSSAGEPGTVRFATGLVFALQPRGARGLEVGFARFFHAVWPRTGIPRSYLTEPFQSFLKASLPSREQDEGMGGSSNQLASVFGRWVLPRSGFEFFAEFGREDHSVDFRDLAQEPDHARSYTLGATKIFDRRPEGFSAVRGEIINFQLPTSARLGRAEGGIYVHDILTQGHTQRGQLLGADVGVGTGAASTLALDRYDSGGRTTYLFERKVQRDAGAYRPTGAESLSGTEVSYALRWDKLRRRKNVDIRTAFTFIAELNRGFQRDAGNFNGIVEFRIPLR